MKSPRPCRSRPYSAAQTADVACDESGSEGEHLIGGNTDVFAHGSVRLTIEEAAVVGKLVAERAKAAGVERVVFDRAGFRYHGRIKSLADAAREAGLEF